MSTLKQQFLTPMIRLVQGHPMEKQDKNMAGQPLVTKAGQPTQRYFMAGAIAKTDPAWPAFFAMLSTVARQSFPQLFDAAGNCTHPRFSWKVADGDGVDDNGKPNAQKDGFAGHWVIKFQSSFPPKVFYAGQFQPHQQVQDANLLKRGWFVRVSGTIEGNGDAMKPGLYVNLGMVEISAQGAEIVSGPDASSVFGAAPAQGMPAGATAFGQNPMAAGPGAQPMTPAMPAMPAMPGAQPAMPTFPGAGPAGPAAVPAMVAPQAPAPMMPVQPNPAFAAGPGAMPAMPGMPAPVAMPTPPAAPVGPQMTPAGAATGFTYAQMLGGGWTDATLRQAGYIV